MPTDIIFSLKIATNQAAMVVLAISVLIIRRIRWRPFSPSLHPASPTNRALWFKETRKQSMQMSGVKCKLVSGMRNRLTWNMEYQSRFSWQQRPRLGTSKFQVRQGVTIQSLTQMSWSLRSINIKMTKKMEGELLTEQINQKRMERWKSFFFFFLFIYLFFFTQKIISFMK